MKRRAWSADDDATALAMRKERKSIEQVAWKLRRTPAAVATRLSTLRNHADSARAHVRHGKSLINTAAIDAFLRKPA